MKEEILAGLRKMIDLGVIEKIPEGESCEWLNSLAFGRKDSGTLRICLDPKHLNLAIKRTYHKTQTVEEVSHKLANMKYFSKLDAKQVSALIKNLHA